MLSFLNTIIRWGLYALFFFVPIIFTGNTSELFELNKMWLTWGLALLIGTAWISKMIIQRQIKIQRTPLDIPLLLFLVSQFLSTIFSLDFHTSFWGYYSRFNGGFLSLVTYIFLYYAFVSNIERKDFLKYLYTILASGVFVALWGLPSHFGYDPTCLVFRGTLDVSCWTFAFQPKVRIFSTLGQPDWLAAYLVYLIPLSLGLGLIFFQQKKKLLYTLFFILTSLFYLDLLYSGARSGFLGIVTAIGVFLLLYLWVERSNIFHFLKAPKNLLFHYWYLLVVFVCFGSITFFVGTPVSQLNFFTPAGVAKLFFHSTPIKQQPPATQPTSPAPASSATPAQEFGGTDSGKIRLFVWQGAWEIFLHNPLLGTGVETFAYAYYQYRPAGHNLTSEWDYLYNKAHNEYLNYLATTGAFGFLTYMGIIGTFLFVATKRLTIYNVLLTIDEKKQKVQSSILNRQSSISLITISLLAAYISILVTNFFGFSVVIMNIFLFITPAFIFILNDSLDSTKVLSLPNSTSPQKHISEVAWIGISAVGLVALYFVIVLIRFWLADTSYAYGFNLDHANEYQAAYSYLHDAVATRPSEPTFQDELTINDAVLSAAFAQQKDTINAQKLAQEAIQVSNQVVGQHPNVVTFWKTRVRVFYTLSQMDPTYLAEALHSIQMANKLAPTDAKVSYNLGLLYAQTGDIQKAIDTLSTTVQLKPDYRDAYYAQALFYRQAAIDKNNHVVNPDMEQKAVDEMHLILTKMETTDDLKIKETLASWHEL